MRKVYVEVKVRILIRANDNVDIDDVLGDMDINFKSNTRGADVEDVLDVESKITDSK